MVLPVITRGRRYWSILATFWIPFAAWRRAWRGVIQLGVRQYRDVLRCDNNRQFDSTLAIAAIMKNEGLYLKEWLDFHILVGVDKFYLYDNFFWGEGVETGFLCIALTILELTL